MAGRTVPVSKRLVQGVLATEQGLDLLVAAQTNFPCLLRCQELAITGMGVMAGQAITLAEWLVAAGLALDLVVTAQA